MSELLDSIDDLKNENSTLKEALERSNTEQLESNRVISELQTKLGQSKIKICDLFTQKNELVKTSEKTVGAMESKLDDLNQNIN